MKYEEGDKVLIKDINWYNKNKDEDGDISCGEFIFVSQMSKFCGKILTIDVDFEDGSYLMKEDTDGFVFTNEMFDTFAEEEVERLTGNLSNSWVNEFELPDGYIFKDENGNIINAQKIVLEKKGSKYPKTYEECSTINGCEGRISLSIIGKFTRLINARNAYWKIAGQEMGLGKPWKPDWSTETEVKYVIEVYRNNVRKNSQGYSNTTLSFPTPEMRDAFYEVFREEIEICKELL
jgi:hypothetical protein